jgi:hypothetical protein
MVKTSQSYASNTVFCSLESAMRGILKFGAVMAGLCMRDRLCVVCVCVCVCVGVCVGVCVCVCVFARAYLCTSA